MSAAAIERFLESLKVPVDQPELKRCLRCGETKSVAAFYQRRKKLKSGIISTWPEAPCKACRSAAEKAHRERWRAEGKTRTHPYVSTPLRRQRRREYETARRRERGIPPRNFTNPRRDGEPSRQGRGRKENWLSSQPLAGLLKKELETRNLDEIAAATEVPERTIFAYLHGERESVSLRVVDLILHGLGKPEEMHRLYPDTSVGYHYIEEGKQ